ncbi:hypothetical protein GGR53DRAFT_216363 [Hypoxylon sp. FL1150]|nr:hypothetical protein GGR53DRAFT_216363 [Hypoxylon sp. FL1150]
MVPKRPLESDGVATPAAKKLRKGFRVGPANLPEGPWKRKVDKIKKDIIYKAKIKKAYKKIKAAEQTNAANPTSATDDVDAVPPSPTIHPERQAMLDKDEEPEPSPPPPNDRQSRRRRHKELKPGYFDKAAAEAERKKAEADARAREIEERNAERNRKLAERERFRKALAKARTPGRDGQRKLGRESGLLLEKVKKMVGDAK